MVEWITYFIIALFGLFCFVFFENIVDVVYKSISSRQRLTYRKKESNESWFEQNRTKSRLLNHIYTLLEVIDFKISMSFYLFSTIFLSAFGAILGYRLLSNYSYMFIFALILGSIPYLYIRWIILGFHNNVSRDELSAYEAFFEVYNSVPTRNMRTALNDVIPHIRYPIRYAFEQLQFMLNTQKGIHHALKIFKYRIGGKWSQEFISIFEIGYTTGVDMTEAFRELLEDMRDMENEIAEDRKRNAEIRWGNIISLFIFLLFLYIATIYNPDWYYYYFIDSFGAAYTKFLVIVLFLMFIAGIYMARKKH